MEKKNYCDYECKWMHVVNYTEINDGKVTELQDAYCKKYRGFKELSRSFDPELDDYYYLRLETDDCSEMEDDCFVENNE